MTTSVRHNFGKLFLLGHLVILTYRNVHYTKNVFNEAVKYKKNIFLLEILTRGSTLDVCESALIVFHIIF